MKIVLEAGAASFGGQYSGKDTGCRFNPSVPCPVSEAFCLPPSKRKPKPKKSQEKRNSVSQSPSNRRPRGPDREDPAKTATIHKDFLHSRLNPGGDKPYF